MVSRQLPGGSLLRSVAIGVGISALVVVVLLLGLWAGLELALRWAWH